MPFARNERQNLLITDIQSYFFFLYIFAPQCTTTLVLLWDFQMLREKYVGGTRRIVVFPRELAVGEGWRNYRTTCAQTRSKKKKEVKTASTARRYTTLEWPTLSFKNTLWCTLWSIVVVYSIKCRGKKVSFWQQCCSILLCKNIQFINITLCEKKKIEKKNRRTASHPTSNATWQAQLLVINHLWN